ncbi:MAG: hypothetical protein JO261_09455 [Alphaproteobacteria bacterium]|nr:hypothetical protein [Alphaproteobacteria bacterium]MBV9693916.1 hypothetical protein [Alphaproteobacteria bacterium]
MPRLFAVLLALCFTLPASAQTMKRLTHQPPDGALITFQLTDGTVMAQGFGESDWYVLTPDSKGSYLNGTWKRVADLPSGYQPLYFASAVLADGRLAIIGGEYLFDQFSFTNLGAIYDPLANKWTSLDHPQGWTNIGDSPSAVLPDGRFLVGDKFKKQFAALDPATLKWTALPNTGKNDFNAEEGWTLLPDGTILTFDVKDHPKSERYLPDQGKWVNAGDIPADLWEPQNCCGNCIPYGPKNKCYDPPGEVGPAILRPDGTVFAAGGKASSQSNAHTDIWTPPSGGDRKGHWTPGPDFPSNEDCGDTFASLLPNGNVLVECLSGTLYEFDGTHLTKEPFSNGGPLMVLPTGEVLIGGSYVYQSTGGAQAAWAPTIADFPSSVTRGQSYQIAGTQFNGLSQANAFGDEDETQTNYPLVRITNNATGDVAYARTHDHSTMGVATGGTPVSTNFDVPANMETGPSTLVVVANGIASAPVALTVN